MYFHLQVEFKKQNKLNETKLRLMDTENRGGCQRKRELGRVDKMVKGGQTDKFSVIK